MKDYNKVQAKDNMQVGKGGKDEETVNDSGSVGPVSERPKLQSVVGAKPKKVKRSLFSRLISGLVGPDGVSGIGGYISEEVIKPAAKNIIVDAVTSGINMIMYGDRGVPNRGGRNTYYGDNRPRTNYTNSYNSGSSTSNGSRTYGREPVAEPRSNIIAKTSGYGVEDYVIIDRYEAAHVLTSLTEASDRFGLVSIADYYDLIRVDSTYTDNNYGWRHELLTAARIVPTQGGYIIKFPPVEAL